MLPRIIQIVKRFGPVGGMETYVWQLAHGLSDRGYPVSVICEQVMGDSSSNIEVLQISKTRQKPRWKSMLEFRERVDLVLKEQFNGQRVIIHSHERSISHQVTTFHGPPIQSSCKLGWFSFLNPRIRAWRYMERHELMHPRVQWVLPVSSLIQSELLRSYPDLTSKPMALAWPGVEASKLPVISSSSSHHDRFIFVGKEWKRKGLLRAIEIIGSYRKNHETATLDIYGVDPKAVPQHLLHLDWVRFNGWVQSIPWGRYDVLIHPAKKEPFGMVVSEARAQGLMVLMSDRVGASDLGYSNIAVVKECEQLEKWVSVLGKLLRTASRKGEIKWTWDDLVELHTESIYSIIKPEVLPNEES